MSKMADSALWLLWRLATMFQLPGNPESHYDAHQFGVRPGAQREHHRDETVIGGE
jgi:hypothetical protein